MPTARYPAIRFIQADDGKPIAMFAAPAAEIELWSGVVQRKRLDDREETVGFQREENPNRVSELSRFMDDEHNVVQNPLLCAAQDLGRCKFFPHDDSQDVGFLEVEWEDLSTVSMLDLLEQLQGRLETRLPNLAGTDPGEPTVAKLRSRLGEDVDSEEDVDEHLAEAAEGDVEDDHLSPESALFDDETHLVDFWREVAARAVLLREMGESESSHEHFLGFSREAIVSYLQPVLIVDGQHRLAGAIRAAEHRANDTEEGRAAGEDLVTGGVDAETANRNLLSRFSRRLPISLLLDDSPEEHVFQFVVVNQKATPIGRALLGTIVSTSLTADELDKVADRLNQASPCGHR